MSKTMTKFISVEIIKRYKVKSGYNVNYYKIDKIKINEISVNELVKKYRRQRWLNGLEIEHRPEEKLIIWKYRDKPKVVMTDKEFMLSEGDVNGKNLNMVFMVCRILWKAGLVEGFRLDRWETEKKLSSK
uniref:Uncharacterized protein n=1 Tax=viral metagenome TaxID=1070528 RepID=A0A6H1ZPY3_9ZZZZ